MLRGHGSLLPSNHAAHTVARLRAAFAQAYALVEPGDESAGHGLPTVAHALAQATTAPNDIAQVPAVAPGLVAARVFTSGSTGEPTPHAKPWHLLVRSALSESTRLGQAFGHDTLEGATLVATVPSQHMYGFESSVLLALHGGAAFDAGRPFFPADIVAALRRCATAARARDDAVPLALAARRGAAAAARRSGAVRDRTARPAARRPCRGRRCRRR